MLEHTENISNKSACDAVKACSLCKISKPHSAFHLKGFDNFGKQRLQSACKDCENIKRNARYQKQKIKKDIKNTLKINNIVFEIKIIHVPNKSDMKKVMSDYIEAIYALPS